MPPPASPAFLWSLSSSASIHRETIVDSRKSLQTGTTGSHVTVTVGLITASYTCISQSDRLADNVHLYTYTAHLVCIVVTLPTHNLAYITVDVRTALWRPLRYLDVTIHSPHTPPHCRYRQTNCRPQVQGTGQVWCWLQVNCVIYVWAL